MRKRAREQAVEHKRIELEWGIDKPLYCMACGTRLERLGHMTADFLMCPEHGEFTPGPSIIAVSEKRSRAWAAAARGEVPEEVGDPRFPRDHYDDERWMISFSCEAERAYWNVAWDNIGAIDAR